MNDRPASSIDEIFRRDFLDKNLVDFEGCVAHYAGLSPQGLMDEARHLFGPDISALPFDLVAGRLQALLVSLVTCAANTSEMTDRKRSRMIRLAIHLDRYLSHDTNAPETNVPGRTGAGSALSATLDGVRLFGLFPVVADLVANHITDYAGTYEETAVIYE